MVEQPVVGMIALQGRAPVWSRDEVTMAVIGVSTGLAVAYLVFRFVRRVPWPRPFRLRFLALHVLAAPLFSAAWSVTTEVLHALVMGQPALAHAGGRLMERLFLGGFLYAVIAGVTYAVEGTGRAARAEAVAARTQLSALRAQLHPHFLFNALHAIVQLIPVDPARATDAAELVADLLRATMDEQRDEVSLREEWRFVSRYLDVERMRFGDRLLVTHAIDDAALDEQVPAFALQTLVENAVHHGVAPRVGATDIIVSVAASGGELRLSVRNSGDAEAARPALGTPGTGLARLRERLAVLYGSAARLACGPDGAGGFEAVLVVPRLGGRPA